MKFTEDYLKQARQVIIDIYQTLRPELLKHFGQVEHELKKDKSVVTQLDLMAEAKITQALENFDSSIGILGEEHGQKGNKKTFWLIDPIDGTESFIRGIPSARNIVTLVDDTKPVMTLAYKFVTDDLFEATKGKGTLHNDKPVHVSQRPLERAWIDISMNLQRPEVLKTFLAVRQQIAGFTILRDFTEFVAGHVEGGIWWQTEGGPWDIAPRGLLFQEAGGRIVNLGSDTFDYRIHSYLAAHPGIFDALNKTIRSCMPATKTVQ